MVRATFSGFTTALTAIQENSKRLDITSNNIANMNTEGYTRQSLETSGVYYSNTVSSYMNNNENTVGYGVSMDSVSQNRDRFLDIQYRDQNSKSGYNEEIDTALSSIESYLDETSMDSLRSSLDDVKTALTNMQDTAKVQDSIYQGELMSALQNTCSLLNSAASSIQSAEKNEFTRLSGEGYSENGSIEEINELLSEIGKLNDDIKRNQLLGVSALELMDERNLAIDKLSSYIPVTVTYYTEKQEVNGEIRDLGCTYDENGKVTGRSSYPEDLKIELSFTVNNNGTEEEKTITLVEGTSKNGVSNYGSVSLYSGSVSVPLDTAVEFKSADSASGGESSFITDTGAGVSQSDSSSGTVSGTTLTSARMSGGSLQASLDMLASSDENIYASGTYRGFDYYMDSLDTLASTISNIFNMYNYQGTTGDSSYTGDLSDGDASSDFQYPTSDPASNNKSFLLLVNSESQDAENVTASNISVSRNWISGKTTIGLYGDDSNETVLNMLSGMSLDVDSLDGRTVSGYVTNLSTVLAENESLNLKAKDINDTVLASIQDSRDQLSGVSLDEEAANMMTYVSAYNAASKVMTAYNEMLETLLGIM